MVGARVLIPLPDRDFDPTESAVPWSLLVAAGHDVHFATPDGRAARADERMLTGRGLGPWRWLLPARSEVLPLYARMVRAAPFRRPLSYSQAAAEAFEVVVLPGGHAPGMRPYLESPVLQQLVARHHEAGGVLAAICHGVLLAARARHPQHGRSILHGHRTTALLRSQELAAWNLTRLWLRDYYRTYPEPVQDEVVGVLADPTHFVTGPAALLRDGPGHLGRGFALRDGRYLSARWPGDAYAFAHALLAMLRVLGGATAARLQ